MVAELPQRILLVEDSSDDAILISKALEEEGVAPGSVHRVASLSDALMAIEVWRPACVLVDLSLPDADGLEAVKTLTAADPDLPLIVLTGGAEDREQAVEAVRRGAQDYLSKADASPAVLRRVITYAVERIAASRKLRESEDLLTQAMHSSPIGMAFVGIDGTYLEVNPAFTRMLGHEHQALIGRHLADVTHPDDVAGTLATYRELVEGRHATYVGEKRYVRADGSELWVLVHVSPVRSGGSGKLQRILLQAQDITPQRQLAESQGRLAAVVANSRAPIYCTDLEGLITSWNPAAEVFYGYTAAEAIGRPAAMLSPPDRRQEAEDNMQQVRRGLGVGPYETQRLRRAGPAVDVVLVMSPILDETGQAIGASTVARDITEQKQARVELERSEQRYRRLIESVHEGIWVFGPDGRTTLVNQRVAELLGYPLEELREHTIWDYVDVSPPGRPLFNADLGSEADGLREVRLRPKDGNPIWALLSKAELTEGGEHVGSIVSLSDITAQRRSEDRFRTLVEMAPDAMVILDHDGRVVLINSEAEKLIGFMRNELLEQSAAALFPPRLCRSLAGPWEALRRGERPRERLEIVMVHRDGHEIPVEIAASPLQTDRGGLVSLSIRDITERLRQDQELEEREQRFRAVFDHAQDAMLIADDDRRYREANRAAAVLLGRSVSELLGLKVEDIAAPELRPTIAEHFSAFMKDGSDSGEFVLTRPDGEQRVVEFAATAGILPGRHLTVMRDITERRQAEEESRRLEVQLQQSRRLESVGMLAGGVAHDFNNLLSIILNYAEYARRQATDGELQEELAEIIEAAERGAALTRQLLIFSRRDLVTPEAIDLREAVAQTLALVRRTLGERITIETDLPADVAPIEIDRGQLDQVLLNLAVNARDAMPQGGELRCGVELVTPDGHAEPGSRAEASWVRLTVRDTGLGMTEEVRSRAFEPFFSTKPRDRGTGLGLATVYGIVTHSGGEISLHSVPGGGATVEIRWPLAARLPEGRDENPDDERPPAGGLTALVVEDEESLRRLMARILAERGYHVLTAGRDEEALAAAASAQIDLLVTDVVMPGLQGPELAAQLRARIPGLPVLFVSGYSEQAPELVDCADLLEKPFTAEQLLEAVERVLDAAAGAGLPA